MSNYKVKTIKGIDAINDYSEMREMKIHISEEEHRVFLQAGFFEHNAFTTNLHNHRYSEIHIVKSGYVDVYINGERSHIPAESAIIVPAGMYHTRRCDIPGETVVCAFQIDLDVKNAYVADIGSVAELLFSEIALYNEKGECRKLSSLLSLVCSYLCDKPYPLPTPIDDREFIIYEFFANNYDKDVTLTDLAAQLRLSEKQAERLIIKSTGMSFRRQIVSQRIENAKMLVKTEGISLAKAAEMVGYQSYSGFWKALQSYEAETEADLDIHPALKEKNIDK